MGPHSVAPESSWLSSTLGSSPTPRPGALGTHCPVPLIPTAPRLPVSWAFAQPRPSAGSTLRLLTAFPQGFHTQLSVSPPAMLLPRLVLSSLLESPASRTVLSSERFATSSLDGPAGPWWAGLNQSRGCLAPTHWLWGGLVSLRGLWGAACPRAWPGTGSERAAAGRFPPWQGHVTPLCSVIRGWGESGQYGLAVCTPASPPAPGPRAGQSPSF